MSSINTPAPTKTSSKLIWLLFVHRHGDRSPVFLGPNDKYNDLKYWPEGLGNLNNDGRLRMFKLGKFIRRRYDHFLTDNIREIYSRSSDIDRCIESSHAVLAGLYTPSQRFTWNKELSWIPSPVHTVPVSDDNLLCTGGRKFSRNFPEEIQKIKNLAATKRLIGDSVEERKLIHKELGYNYDDLFKILLCSQSNLDIEERCGLEMPKWYSPKLKERLRHFAGVYFALDCGGTDRTKQIRCGHLFDDIIKRMRSVPIKQSELVDKCDLLQDMNAPSEVDNRRVIHYSTHDSDIVAILESLNLNDPPVPPGFGATFFFELHVDIDEESQTNGEKYVKLFHLDDTGSENPIEKKLPNCKYNERGQLTLDAFVDYVRYILPNEAN